MGLLIVGRLATRSEATSRTTGIETILLPKLPGGALDEVRKLHPGQQGLKRPGRARPNRATTPHVRKLHPGQQGLKPPGRRRPTRRHGHVRKLHPGQQGLKRRPAPPGPRLPPAGGRGLVRKLHPGQQGLKRSRPPSRSAPATTVFGSYIQDNRD